MARGSSRRACLSGPQSTGSNPSSVASCPIFDLASAFVAAEEHAGALPGESRVGHVHGADRVEGLHNLGSGGPGGHLAATTDSALAPRGSGTPSAIACPLADQACASVPPTLPAPMMAILIPPPCPGPLSLPLAGILTRPHPHCRRCVEAARSRAGDSWPARGTVDAARCPPPDRGLR
jgi:hypothetical protein